MYCSNQITHTIKQGDTFYLLAKHYHTTADKLMALNPDKDPYNLQIDDTLIICPGPTYPNHAIPPIGIIPTPPIHPVPPIGINPYPRPPIQPQPPIATLPPVHPVPPIATFPPVRPQPIPPISGHPCPSLPIRPVPPIGSIPPDNDCDIIIIMREAWKKLAFWTRMIMVSIINRLNDRPAIMERFIQNAYDISTIFSNRFSNKQRQLDEMLKEHLTIGVELLLMLSEGRSAPANRLNEEWYLSADRLARFFSELSQAYPADTTKHHIHNMMDTIKEQATKRMLGHYGSEVEAFDRGALKIQQMADYFANGML
ncbi:MAG: LysM domain-containing protein [Firmicutes bacterium]|nr:LysM domain-containing protein [Bacillota bacterium]